MADRSKPKCRVDNHLKPVKTGESTGKDAQGNKWKEEHWKCDACGKTWTETSGKGA